MKLSVKIEEKTYETKKLVNPWDSPYSFGG